MSRLNIIKFEYRNNSKEIYSIVENLDWAVLLDSNSAKFPNQNYDIISCNPIKKIFGKGTDSIFIENSEEKHIESDPINVLRENMDLDSNHDELPFTGGAIGFLSYDQGNTYENINQKSDDFKMPYIAFGIYDWAIILDHKKKETILVFKNKNNLIENLITKLSNEILITEDDSFTVTSDYKSNLTYEEYEKRFQKIQKYITDGDCYQINFSQRFSLSYEGSAWAVYRKLCNSYAAPYSAYMNYPFAKIMCFSPERFLYHKGDFVETRPIKGTRPVSSDQTLNSKYLNDLSTSKKEKAENLMIVDLLRNDFGRNCEFGSVNVSELFKIETFSNVHHLVSTVQGKISSDSDIFKLLRECFPGGSITGAPKIRAMQIINELEKNNRGIYCGAIGYISNNNQSDLNIAIRTAITINNKIYFWGGGGITSDSVASSEYEETLDKIKPLLNSLRR